MKRGAQTRALLHVGDLGHRYEVRATGYPKETESVIGWSNNMDGANVIASAIRKAPGCTSTVIFDRQENKQVIRRFAGILR